MLSVDTNKSIKISDYLLFVKEADRLPEDDLAPVLHGLYGEVGGLMTAAKKLKREPGSFTGFDRVVIEEFGDAFWYLCCLSLRLNVDIENVFVEAVKDNVSQPEILVGLDDAPLTISYKPGSNNNFDEILIELGQLTGSFLSAEFISDNSSAKVLSFLKAYFSAISILKLNFSQIIKENIAKISGRFLRPHNSELPVFDSDFIEFEQLPNSFEIEFVQRTEHHQAMRWNGVFIGSPLTDSIKDVDGYRFHDVFHFSYASILHWSPTFRALIKHKRKSNPLIDQAEDGGRAIVVEEGLSAWIFTIAKENNLFLDRDSLTFDMLKNVHQIVKGYEVEECPLILWEEAILKGYEIFRQVLKNDGGIVIGNKQNRTLEYKKK